MKKTKTHDKDSQYCSTCSIKTSGEKLKPSAEKQCSLHSDYSLFQI